MKPIKLISIFILAILINSCANQEKTSETTEGHHDTHEGHEDEITLTGEQINLVGIKFEKAEQKNITGYIKATGEVKINPDQESKVGGIIPGRIHSIRVKEGAYVGKGQILATIENVDLVNVQTDYALAKNELQFAKQEFERQKRLSEDNIGSKKTLAQLEADYKRALTNVKAYEEKLSAYRISKNIFIEDSIVNVQKYFSITAPISGKVVSRNVTIGQFVDPSTDMFLIVNTTKVFVDINVFEKDLSQLTTGQKVDIESSVYPDEIFQGKISTIGNMFDGATRTVKVRVGIDNNDGKLLPNMFVTAKIYINDKSVLSVSKGAIEEDGEKKFIYIKPDEEMHTEGHDEHEGHSHEEENNSEDEKREKEKEGIVFKRIEVRTGVEDDKNIEIIPLEEIGKGEIVTDGVFYLKSERQKGELGEHSH